MNKKRIAALIAAGTLLLSAMPVSAAPLAASDTATELSATGGSTTVSSSGTVNAWDGTPVFKVTLPTANSLKFTVDPYGLANLASGSARKLSELPTTGSGTILAATGSGALMKNKSNVDVLIGVKAWVADSGEIVQLVSSSTDVATGTAANMHLVLCPGDNKAIATNSSVTFTPVAEDDGVAVTATAQPETDTVQFKLAKAEYEVTNTGNGFTLDISNSVDDNYDAAALAIGGSVNRAANWGAYSGNNAETLVLSAIFAFGQAPDGVVMAASSSGYAVVSGTAVIGGGSAAPAAPVTLTGSFLTETTGDADYALVWKKAANTLTLSNATATSFKFGSTAANVAALSNANASWFTANGSTISIAANAMSALNNGTVRYLEITLDNGDTIMIKITVRV